MIIKSADFEISVASKEKILMEGVPEFAFVGKSNVGKSTFINFLTNKTRLAKTSKEPGRTRLINYFSINKKECYFVDLPGFGFARVSDKEKEKWAELIEGYFSLSPSLKGVFFLVDIRRDPSEDDIMMINYLYHYMIPFTIVASKADKLSRSASLQRVREIAKKFTVGVNDIIIASSLKKQGKEEILQKIELRLSSVDLGEDDEEILS